MTTFTRLFLASAFTLVGMLQSFGQSDLTVQDVAKLLTTRNAALTSDDVSGLMIDRQYVDHKGIRFLYATQTVNSIPIFEAVASIAISADGQTTIVNEHFIPSAQDLVDRPATVLDTESAARYAFSHVGADSKMILRQDVSRSTAEKLIYNSELLNDDGAQVQPRYFLRDGKLRLTWDVSFFPLAGVDYWSIKVDAGTGELIDKMSYTTHCQFDHHAHQQGTPHICRGHQHTAVRQSMAMGDGAVYNVFALPAESPIHGDRQLLTEPADVDASPYGWHDLNGVEGADTDVTEGNNVRAWLDRSGDQVKDRDVTAQNGLTFDFPYNPSAEPTAYEDLATVNLFYMCNMMHDFSYHYGFTPEAGNFQVNNYQMGGDANDEVLAFSQFNVNGSINNANFATPTDGNSGSMRMFLWNTRNDLSVFEVLEPASVAGQYASRTAGFGAVISEVGLEGEVAIADDNVGQTADACEPITNGSELAGKIAIIDRGDCEFGFKILNAEQQGAIGAIICNNVPGILSGQMGAGAVGNQVTIPSVFITTADCNAIRVFAGSGLRVKFQTPPDNGEPDRVDGSLDNGIIAHEFGHGISTRLTGGPYNSGCLVNNNIGAREEGEQMGEGWSDFFSLVTTAEPGDAGTDSRGIGNYAQRNPVDGPGIRRYPYSTDMTINPVTYYETYNTSVPHGVGQVWCSMLWDLYWLLVDRYTWDPDLLRGKGGNNICIQLVMDGMKIQPCNPGFVDGRDAILAADEMNNGGANHDLIWEAFARRGLGLYADQGRSDLIADGKEDYTIPPQFVKTVKFEKYMTPTILRNENIDVKLTVRNDMDETATNVQIIDEIPAETSVVMSTLPTTASVDGNQITFVINEIAPGTILEIDYQLETPDIPSILQYYDDFEAPDTDGGKYFVESPAGGQVHRWSSVDPLSGDRSWRMSNVGAGVKKLFSIESRSIIGAKPVIRFAHKYDMDAGNDAGIFEISLDLFESTIDMGDHIIRHGYDNHLRDAAFPTNKEEGWSRTTNDSWVYSYIDLADYANEDEMLIQWTFSGDEEVATAYWNIDDLMYFDARTYNSEACLSFDGAAAALCAEAPEWGTIVEPEEYSSTNEQLSNDEALAVYPNPVNQLLTIELNQSLNRPEVIIYDAQGRQQWVSDEITSTHLQVPVVQWSTGLYIVQVKTADQTYSKRFIKK